MGKTISFTIDPDKIRKGVRDERIKEMITSTGGVVRVFKDKKKAKKADKVGRKKKYRNEEE